MENIRNIKKKILMQSIGLVILIIFNKISLYLNQKHIKETSMKGLIIPDRESISHFLRSITKDQSKCLSLKDDVNDGVDLENDYQLENESNQNENNAYDCLDIFNRQHLAVLFYSQCETSPVFPNICNKPRVINMKYYSENDMTLGIFFFFNLKYYF